MKHLIILFIVFIVTLSSYSQKKNTSGVVMFRNNPSHSGMFEGNPVKSFPERKFVFKTNGAVRSTPAIYDGSIYFGSADGFLYCIDKKSGEEKWKFKTNGSVSSSPAITDELVFFSSRDKNVYALNRLTGKMKWKFEMEDELDLHWGFDNYLSSPAIIDKYIYTGSGDGNLYKLNLTNGKLIWKYKTPSRIRSTPAYADGMIYFGDMDGKFYAVDENGILKWSYNTLGYTLKSEDFGYDRRSILSSPSVAEGMVYFGGRDGILYALDTKTGTEKWKFDHNISWVIGSPAVSDGKLYVGSSDGRFVQCIDIKTGKEIWRANSSNTVWSSPTLVNDVVYFGDGNGNLYAVKASSGEQLFRYRVEANIFSSPVFDDGVIYFGSDDYNLYALTGSTEENNSVVHKAVFLTERKGFHWLFNEAQQQMSKYFTEDGYQQLDTDSLKIFFDNIIKSKEKAIVIFISSRFPNNILNDSADTDLLREFLKAGGRIVLPGINPAGLVTNAAGDTVADVNFTRPEKLLGNKYAGVSFVEAMGGKFQSYSTEEGKKWGMKESFISSFGINPEDATTILAKDEYGKATAWFKEYGNNGGGIIQLWVERTGAEDYSFIKSVAEHGLK